MKRSILIIVLSLFINQFISGQTATNFNCNDCAGENHDLFSEIDDGRIIVLCWVMPCGPCLGPSLTSFNVVKSFEESDPDRVFLYIIDDYGDTKCGPLNSWVKDKGLSGSTVFSDATIDMANFGAFGMPKIVVVGGPEHQIFYQAEYTVDANLLHAAITDALIASPTRDLVGSKKSLIIYPNPSDSEVTIEFSMSHETEYQINILNSFGQIVMSQYQISAQAGEQSISLNTSGLKPGSYTVQVKGEKIFTSAKLEVTH